MKPRWFAVALLIAALGLAGFQAAQAQEDAEAPQPETGSAGSTPAVRDPFWPVGYWPEEDGPAGGSDLTHAGLKWPSLTVKGLTRGPEGKYFAIIQDVGIVEEGDIISVRRHDFIFRWKIEQITGEGVVPGKLDVRSARANRKPNAN